jgi:RNA polymerase sigma factor (sigma-70 family)
MPPMSVPQTGQKPPSQTTGHNETPRTDAELIAACLEGDGDAWEALVNRYRRLIYSIPFKWGLQREDAMEVFQAVWLDCFQELHLLRDIDRLQAWLVRIAVRKCYRLKAGKLGKPEEVEIIETDHILEDQSGDLLRRLDQEQMIRTTMGQLSERCQQVISALFFEDPFPGYAALAERLGLSSNSIGFTRDRCLQRMGKLLKDQGYEN